MTGGQDGLRWVLTLYVRGASARSTAALETVRRICDEELAGQVELQIVDVHADVMPVVRDHIVALPTLVKRLPSPLRQIVGDLADDDRLRFGLDLGPSRTGSPDPEPGLRPGPEPQGCTT